MKLNPKIATFCPGCNHKSLELKEAPTLIIQAEKKESPKKITIFSKNKPKSKNSLF